MEYSGGYLLLSSASTDQSIYLEQLTRDGYPVDKLISMDKEVGGVFPNLFDIWQNRKLKRPTPVLSEQVMEKILISMVFGTLENAREAYREAKSQDTTVRLIGISLDEKYIQDFHDNRSHLNEENGEGVVLCLEKKQPPDSEGVLAGYDIAGYETGGRFLSYLGNHLLAHYQTVVPDIPINQFGLFSDLQKAELFAHHTNDVFVESIGAEDLMWLPWKIMIYESS